VFKGQGEGDTRRKGRAFRNKPNSHKSEIYKLVTPLLEIFLLRKKLKSTLTLHEIFNKSVILSQ